MPGDPISSDSSNILKLAAVSSAKLASNSNLLPKCLIFIETVSNALVILVISRICWAYLSWALTNSSWDFLAFTLPSIIRLKSCSSS